MLFEILRYNLQKKKKPENLMMALEVTQLNKKYENFIN